MAKVAKSQCYIAMCGVNDFPKAKNKRNKTNERNEANNFLWHANCNETSKTGLHSAVLNVRKCKY